MGFTRSAGYRGGSGSLPKYLLEKDVLPKIITKMMSLIIKINDLTTAKHHEEVMVLLLTEFNAYNNDHVKNWQWDGSGTSCPGLALEPELSPCPGAWRRRDSAATSVGRGGSVATPHCTFECVCGLMGQLPGDTGCE